ncbi:MAG TPA: cob(I)yrinic acid a,c-diamide adenosyltransferase, partial [Bacteroidales bacterium]
IEAYGTVDELISHIGLIRDQPISVRYKNSLLEIQNKLMVCASILATDCDDCEIKLPELNEKDIIFLEQEIDSMEAELEPLRLFVLPGGHTIVSYCHIARTVCRRAERISIQLSDKFNVPENVLKYINRLSDYLFVLARKLGKDLNVEEIPWRPVVN